MLTDTNNITAIEEANASHLSFGAELSFGKNQNINAAKPPLPR